jgi:ferritin-like metal-binding protein YciE
MQLNDLQDLFVDELRDLYNAEHQIIKALPKLAKAATNPALKQAFEQHLEQTRGHVDRLEQVFDLLGQKAQGKKCRGMQGIIDEGKELLDEDVEDDVLDAGLISAAQRVEHYEMAGYGAVRTYAKVLGNEQAARLLQQTLDEEGQTDKVLTKLAQTGINLKAKTGA